MNTPFQLRTCTPHDAPRLARLRIEFLSELLGKPDPATDAACMRELTQYFEQADPANYVSVVAELGGDIIATGALVRRQQPGGFSNPSGVWGYILNMYTLPEYRRQGIAAKILQELQVVGKGMGIHHFELHATHMGHAVYVRDGFVVHAEPTLRKSH